MIRYFKELPDGYCFVTSDLWEIELAENNPHTFEELTEHEYDVYLADKELGVFDELE